MCSSTEAVSEPGWGGDPERGGNPKNVADGGRQQTARVSVVIPCFQQGHFLGEAIRSVLNQTWQDLELIVVDDGSTDTTAQVAASFETVRYVHQQNGGLAAARNTGLRLCRGTYVVFVDADDRLLPRALEAGLASLEDHPECAFTFGTHRRFGSQDLSVEMKPFLRYNPDFYRALLRGNYVGMHATVMYRRGPLASVGGFDERLRACEDYDCYFRITRKFPICCYDEEVAEYRIHPSSMSSDPGFMLRSALRVLRAQRKHLGDDARLWDAYGAGVQVWTSHYRQKLIERIRAKPLFSYRKLFLAPDVLLLLRHSLPLAWVGGGRPRLAPAIRKLFKSPGDAVGKVPGPSQVRLGDLRRLKPISNEFGYDRGRPIDRYYIERFLGLHCGDIRGRVLEVGEDVYTRRFGEDRVEKSDVLHVSHGNPKATLMGDLTDAPHIASELFDCIICTQTLQFLYDLEAGVATLHRILKPGGVLLATAPGISKIQQDEWGKYCCWAFTKLSLTRLFSRAFQGGDVTIEAHGNVLTSIAFLHGLADSELSQEELDFHDPLFQLLITVRASKPLSSRDGG